MPNGFGSDFNQEQPSDDDLVKLGAGWIRDIKRRIKTVWGVLFNLETGELKDHVVAKEKLKVLEPSPEGVWNQVTVSPEGIVTGGETVEMATSANINRYTYLFGAGLSPTGEAIAVVTGADETGLTVGTYSFTVPDGVHRLLVRAQAAGGGADAAIGGGGGGYAESIAIVEPGDVWLVWVGQGGQGAAAGTPQAGSTTKFEFDPGKWLKAAGGQAGSGSTGGIGYAPANNDLAGVLTWYGGAGTASVGGGSGDGSPSVQGQLGWGGFPTAGGGAGGNGYVIIEYWL